MNVSIAIPTYNRGEILVETIDRLLALEPGAAEIVVVDQTETYPPPIEEKLARHASAGEIRWIRLPKPSIPHAMNEALRLTRSKIVLFVDDDILPSPYLAAAHERAYESGVWAVVGQVLQPGEEVVHADSLTIHDGAIRDLEFPFNHDVAVDVENVIACNLSVDRERAIEIGGFDENYLAAAYRFESDFAKRIVAAGGRVRFDPAAGIRHLKMATGGVRAHGDHRTMANPAHTAGDYYFAIHHVPAFWRYAARRLVRNVATRFHLRHPWTIPPKIAGEIRGLFLARKLARHGRRLIGESGESA
jgi:glycosyltransferase involved in cell wall biosynthesis